MKQEVVISIAVKQDYQDGEDEVMELVTKGTMEYQDESAYEIYYEESEMTGLEGTTTRFFIEKDAISLVREGSVRSRMQFELGKRHKSAYVTAYGAMDVEVHTRHFAHNISPQGGEIALEYDIEISQNVLGNNFFHIKVSIPTHKWEGG